MERSKDRDKLCKFEDFLIKKYGCCYWLFDFFHNPDTTLIEFIKNDIDVSKQIEYLITLPYSNTSDDYSKLNNIWNLYDDKYFEETDTKKIHFNAPGGYFGDDTCIFIGEAPGWTTNEKSFGTRVYTFGATSMTFRMCSSYVFGKAWYTNISKAAVRDNKKLSRKCLEKALLRLDEEISILNPKRIICLGNYVYDVIETVYNNTKHNIMKIYHPAYIFRNGNHARDYLIHMRQRLIIN